MSHTAHPLYDLKGEVPETVMWGPTSDISQYAELMWYDFVYFKDNDVGYPEDDKVVGRYPGPGFDVGPAMCGKFVKANGEVVYQSTYRRLTKDE